MTKELLATTFALALTLPAAAFAETAMDADGDGMVTMTEFQDAMPDAEAGTFSQADTDGDGALSADEVAAAQEAGVLPSEG
ncbi:EF-hand domain-containing protein [uncultured Roseovarius sp.]|uniref:EF-hand domain-containing protein n=1 Tax=uncultured Roseovarius sp. TaxID=293344 RepID=UPI0025F32482|nr:EF-hand domain-containing protein [uncultured Roseovarius sp.]